MDHEPQEPRASLWSVPARWAGVYLWLFGSQTVAWLVLLIIREVNSDQSDSIIEKAINVGVALAPLMVVSAGMSMLIVEVPMVFAEKYLYHRYTEGRLKGHEEGRAEGLEEGREEGIEEGILAERARYEAYLDAFEEATRHGHQPPPRPSESDNGHYPH